MTVKTDTNKESMLALFNALHIPVLFTTAAGAIVSANKAAQNAFGYADDEICRLALKDLFADSVEKRAGWAVGSSIHEGDGGTPVRQFEAECRKRDGEFFDARVTIVKGVVRDLLAVVIEDVSGRMRLERRASQRTKERAILSGFADILNKDVWSSDVLKEALELLAPGMGGDAAFIHLRCDDDSGGLDLKTQYGCDPNSLKPLEHIAPGECLSGKVFASGRPLLVKKADEDPRVSRINRVAPGIRSIAAAPIASRGNVFGVIAIASSRPAHFSSMDIQLLSIVGGQLGVAMDNALLIKELRGKMNQIELTNELAATINTSLSIGTIFRIMVSEIKRFLSYDRASLLLYDEKRKGLVIFALDTEMKTAMPRGVKAPIDGTTAGWVVMNNRPWINEDLSVELRFKHDGRLLEEGIRSTISVPLYQDRVIGAFNLDSTSPSKYSEKDLEVLLPAARHISIALENALLFDEISREKREWERTFDAISDMVWIEDFRQNVLRANRALLKQAGLSVAEVAGKHCTDILKDIGIGTEICLCGDTIESRKESFREIRDKQGNIFHFWAYPLLDEEGVPYAIVHYLKDVTERRQLEQQLVRADKLASLGTLLAGIAHEINNPLGIIAGYSEALLERASGQTLRRVKEFEDFPEYLETIHKEIFRCKEVLSSLLEFSRPHAGKSRELDINELIKEVILLVNYKAKRLHHVLDVDLDRNLPKLSAEAGSLRQLFMNIIINSMYHTPEGGRIRIESGPAPDGDRKEMIQIVISDNGEGIPPEIIDKIFDPFFTGKSVGEGTGLGLAICHKIAEEHGGSIDVWSKLGEGTAFTVKLPSRKARHREAPA